MADRERPIIFITPGASRVGGNVFFLDFLKWFKKNSNTPFITIYGHGGELEPEFHALGDAFRFDAEVGSGSVVKRGIGRAARKLDLRKRHFQGAWLKSRLRGNGPGMVYSNAVTNIRMLSAIPIGDAPIISHCHELDSVIYRSGIEGFRKTAELTTKFVAASNAVKQNLVERHQVDTDKIDVVHEFIPIREFSKEEIAAKRKKVYQELGIPDDALVVGGSGTLYWRKAPELFVQTASLVNKKFPGRPVYFMWVGGGEPGDFRFFELNYDIEKLGLTGKVHFVEHKADPSDHFAAIDVFLMVSREDPYPLVCLETAAMGKPVICFENAGGMPEFVEDDCGYVVPYLDLDTLAERIGELAGDRTRLAKLGTAAATKVRARHDIEIAAPKVLELIDRYRIR